MAQRPPRMPRRNTPEPVEQSENIPAQTPEDSGLDSMGEPPTDALHVVAPVTPAKKLQRCRVLSLLQVPATRRIQQLQNLHQSMSRAKMKRQMRHLVPKICWQRVIKI
ncbi:hypothetical protein [Glutamicibacter sp. M10]|uniref:hypothetical protein n=1 Tax=Glutamicibacter sp. M10 TaxID=3023076 RepID=UPI0021C88156|nr:hypothetical protein [Glutamicibacter sp. M10]UXN31806.1 hypothetical protein N6V40_16115 [Glutamicibacter sp. M10]